MKTNSKLYNEMIHSLDKEIKIAIKEQFNVNDLDFNDNHEYDSNIFDKEPVYIEEICDKIIYTPDEVQEFEIEYLDKITTRFKLTNP